MANYRAKHPTPTGDLAASIIAPDTPPANSKPVSAPGIHSIDISPADNGGFMVTHSEKTGKKGEDEWSGTRKKNAFTDAHSAHAHIGRLMGVGGGHHGGSGGGLK